MVGHSRWMVPISLLLCIIVTRIVSPVIAFSTSAGFTLPLESTGMYNFTVDWGDNVSSSITLYNQSERMHTYASQGIYQLVISGQVRGWRFNNGGDKLKILELSQWGSLNFGNSDSYFYGASNLKLTASDAPDLNSTTSLYQTFYYCENLGSEGNMNG